MGLGTLRRRGRSRLQTGYTVGTIGRAHEIRILLGP